jgi:hypothetical protein
MGINSRQIICGICGTAVLTDLFGNHQHVHTHVSGPLYALSPWGVHASINGTSTSTTTSSSR